ncbi:hypothetical protein M2H10_20665 [Vibrio vulnificus]|nr:hypothetical protein [Vibrio vulnificus]MCU8159268.1 hypothetical protein [Vibrio vulnificus]
MAFLVCVGFSDSGGMQ